MVVDQTDGSIKVIDKTFIETEESRLELDGAESSTFSAPPGSAVLEHYTFDGSFSDASDQNYQAGDAVYDTFGINKISISSSFIFLSSQRHHHGDLEKPEAPINLEAPGDNDWEGSLFPRTLRGVRGQDPGSTSATSPSRTPDNQRPWVVKTDNFDSSRSLLLIGPCLGIPGASGPLFHGNPTRRTHRTHRDVPMRPRPRRTTSSSRG